MALEYNEKTGHYSRIPNSIEDLLIVDSVDPVIVDPPYGIGDFSYSDSTERHKKIEWNNEIPSKE